MKKNTALYFSVGLVVLLAIFILIFGMIFLNEKDLRETFDVYHLRFTQVSTLVLDDPVKGPDYAGVSQIGENSVELSFNLFCKGRDYVMLHSLLFPVVGKFPLHGPDLSLVLPLTGKPDASDTKTQIGRE